MSTPLLTVSCITYNHEKYIRDAIEGLLMQKTTFPIEILIHDDASTDGTANIIREYAKKYPDLIFPIYQKENQFSKGNRPGSFIKKRARGKYYAICEGDDYWTDPNKLQKQVDFLEANPEYSLCFHNALVVYENRKTKPHLFAHYAKNTYNINDVIEKPWFVATQSIVYRRQMMEDPNWLSHIQGGDYCLQLILAAKGPFHLINKQMGVYRKHGTSLSAKTTLCEMRLNKIQRLYYFDYYTNFQYTIIIETAVKAILNNYYKDNIYDRPFLIKIFTFDYYIFKLKSLVKRVRRIINSEP